MTMTEYRTPYNGDVARRLGMSRSGVSRLRSGGRNPSNSVMKRVEQAYDWPLVDQYLALQQGNYHTEFEKVLGAG